MMERTNYSWMDNIKMYLKETKLKGVVCVNIKINFQVA